MRWLLALMLTTGWAHADDAPPRTLDLDTTLWPDRGTAGSAFVAADSGTRTGVGVVVGAEGQFGDSTDGCNFAATSGTGALRIGPAPVSAEHRASVCVGMRLLVEELDITVLPVSIDHTLTFQGVPKLSARRVTWSEPYTNEQLDIGIHLATFRGRELDAAGWSILGLPITGHLDWLYQPLTGDSARLYETRHAMTAYMIAGRQERTGGMIHLLGGLFAGPFWKIDFMSIEDVQLGSSPLLLDAQVGSAETLRYVDDLFVRAGGITGRFGLGLVLGPVKASASIEHDYHQTIDEAVIGDTRADAELAFTRGRWSATAAVFHSATDLIYTDGSGRIEYEPTYGVELGLTAPVGKRLDARVGGAWARSFYSKLAPTAPTVAPGFELTAQLVARFGKLQPEHRR